MDYLIAIKAESPRKVVRSETNRINILLTGTGEEPADKTVLHKDKAYLNCLDGNCFKCSKLSPVPQDVCNIVDNNITPFAGESCNYLDPCTCYICPPRCGGSPCYRCGAAGFATTGYPAVTGSSEDLQEFGSGYWVGLQSSSFYANVQNGGWVVFVSCKSSNVVGAIPVSSDKFGYGKGYIGEDEVMMYPAGVVYKSGVVPANDTAFPILALTKEEGDVLWENIIGTTNIIFLQAAPGSPSDPAETNIFCSEQSTVFYIGGSESNYFIETLEYPTKTCLKKYGSSACPEFNDYYVGPSNDLEIGWNEHGELVTQHTIDLASFYTQMPSGNTPFFKSMIFESSYGNYAIGAKLTRANSDALSGPCCTSPNCTPLTPPIEVNDSCQETTSNVTPPPCNYISNTVIGTFNGKYGGFNSADIYGLNGIGPNSPPYFQNIPSPEDAGDCVMDTIGSNLKNSDFWVNSWKWTLPYQSSVNTNIVYDPEARKYNPDEETPDLIGGCRFVPPHYKMMENCTCDGLDKISDKSIVYFVEYTCDNTVCKCPEINKTEITTNLFSPCSGSTCGQSLCVTPGCGSCPPSNSTGLGPPRPFVFIIPCKSDSVLEYDESGSPIYTCYPSQKNNSNPEKAPFLSGGLGNPNSPDPITGTLLDVVYEPKNKPFGTIVTSDFAANCGTAMATVASAGNCSKGCNNTVSVKYYDDQPNVPQSVTLNADSLSSCTGQLEIGDCFKSRFMPQAYQNFDFTFDNTPLEINYNDNNSKWINASLSTHLLYNDNGTTKRLSESLGITSDNLEGYWSDPFNQSPLAVDTTGKCGNVMPGALGARNCTYPVTYQETLYCSDNTEKQCDTIKFINSGVNERCYKNEQKLDSHEVPSPCNGCNNTILPDCCLDSTCFPEDVSITQADC